MKIKNNNALTVGLCLSLAIVLIFNVYAVENNEAYAVQWITIRNDNVSIHPNTGIIDSNGNIDITEGANPTVIKLSGSSPYSLLASSSVSNLGCTGMTRSMWNDAVNGKIYASCSTGGSNNLIQFDQSSLGVLNSTTQTSCCASGVFKSGNVLYGMAGGTPNIYTWFISGSNFIRCSANPGQCGGGLTYPNVAGVCTAYSNMAPDFVNGVVYASCTAPSAKIYKLSMASLTTITSWALVNGCIAQCSSVQNTLVYDPTSNGVWSSETGGTLVFYNSTGSNTKTITVAGATSGLQAPQIVGNTISAVSPTQSLVYQWFLNGTQISAISFATQIVTPVTSAESFSVSTNNIAVLGMEANAGSSQIILGGFANGNIPSGGGGGGNNPNCPANTVNCGDVNCNLPQNAGLLMCNVGQGPINNNGFFINTGINNLLIGSGLINSTNTNIKTNGVGYILVLVEFGILISMFWLASGGEIKNIPTFVWFIATLGVLGLSTALGLIDVTFFIVGAIAIIALASAKIMSTLELGGF